MEFEWDGSKAESDLRKHGVAFEEASTAFVDSLAAIFPDSEHADEDEREILIGYSEKNRLLIVSFAERAGAIRLISARVATPGERRNHENKLMGGWKS